MENSSENCENSIESGSESDDSVISISSDDNDSAASTALIFVDLTHNEVVEDVDHEQPNADTTELARISQLFVKSIIDRANVTIRKRKRFDASKDSDASGSTGGNSSETGANALADNSDSDKISESLEQTLVVEEDGKIGNTANVTIRKRNRFKVDKNSTGPYMRCLSSPIRRMLEQSIAEHTLETHEKFLLSLNDAVPIEQACIDSHKYKLHFGENKTELVQKLWSIFDQRVFDSNLNDDIASFVWSNWHFQELSAGACCHRIRNGVRCVVIYLSEKLLISAERLRDVLLHELCHAAVWIINAKAEADGHGDVWQSWVEKASNVFPNIPRVTVYHNYENIYKFMYKCVICSSSAVTNQRLDGEKLFCSWCHGPVEVFLNKLNSNGTRQMEPMKMRFGFAQYVKRNYSQIKESKPTASHSDILKELSGKFTELTTEQVADYRKSFGNL